MLENNYYNKNWLCLWIAFIMPTIKTNYLWRYKIDLYSNAKILIGCKLNLIKRLSALNVGLKMLKV